jgi:hypothetical protein
MREDISNELLLGSVDKFGQPRDAEKRAVLMYVNRMLSFVPSINRQYDELSKRKEQQEDRAQRKEEIHGTDVISTNAGYDSSARL